MEDVDLFIKRIGANIIKIRKAKKIKQIDLAISLDIEDSALRRIEKGRTNPTIKTLYHIAKELNVDISDLIS